jgi:hypothetical protein
VARTGTASGALIRTICGRRVNKVRRSGHAGHHPARIPSAHGTQPVQAASRMVASHQALRGHPDLSRHRARLLERAASHLARNHGTTGHLAELGTAVSNAATRAHCVGSPIGEPDRHPPVDQPDRRTTSHGLASGPRIPQPHLAGHAPLKDLELETSPNSPDSTDPRYGGPAKTAPCIAASG